MEVVGSIADSAPAGEAAIARRALGIAYRSLGRIPESIRELEASRDALQEQGDESSAAESEISLAASVAMSGDLTLAISMLEPLTGAEEPSVRAHAQVQKAGLVARAGDFPEALSLYASAQPELEDMNDERWLALLHSTRGLVRCYSGDFRGAEEDLQTSRQLFLDLNRDSSAAEMLHNLGFVAVQRGDIARGLSLLLEAEDSFERAGLPIEAILSDRSHAYMLAGVPRSAFESAVEAAKRLEGDGRELERMEALYFSARAALAAGDPKAAFEAATEAERLAREQGRISWRLMAAVVGEEASLRAGRSGSVDRLVKLADSFVNEGNVLGQSHALALAALRELEQGDLAAAEEYLEAVELDDPSPVEIPVWLLVAVASAKVKLAKGERSEAIETLQAAADLVDERRLLLSATEARAGITRLADEVADVGLEAFAGDGAAVIGWAERFRGAWLRTAPVVTSPDPELASALAELRGKMQALEEMVLAGEDTAQASADARHVENRIRDLAMAHGSRATISVPIPELPTLLGELSSRTLLYIYDVADRTFGVVASAGEIEHHELGDRSKIRALAGHLAAAMRREFLVPGRSRPDLVFSMIDEVGQLLFGPAQGASSEMVVVPPPDLHSLPWNAMARAISRPLLSVTVSPSAGLWLDCLRRSRGEGDPIVVAGPRLPHAAEEARRVAQVYENHAEVLVGEAATVTATARAMERHSVLHAVAHTSLRYDNPMFSALELADGFLNLYDIESIATIPKTVVLSACDSSHGNVVGGHEMYGLASLLLSRGARSIIATVAPIPDSEASVAASVRIHEGLSRGNSAVTALHDAIDGGDRSAVDPSLAFVVYGAG
ncbi:MAG TPA: CHAT domain-containing protein [Acidimicrobiia bacterium]|nr:CHAT domain-containing protein [Acidimicrobiia bacterium]